MGRLSPQLATAEPQARSPERQRLADAIENLAKAKAKLSKIQQAQSRHIEESTAADRRLDAAQEALETLHSNEEKSLLAEFLGDGAEAKLLREAQRAVQEAIAEVEKHDRLRAALRNAEREAEEAVASGESNLRIAHLAALSADPSISNLVARFVRIKQELYDLLQVVELTRAASGYSFHPLDPPRVLDTSELTRWKAAIEALKSDADVELP